MLLGLTSIMGGYWWIVLGWPVWAPCGAYPATHTHTHISHVVGVDKYHGRILVDSAGLTGVGAVRGISCNTSVK
jgi:hypothetical protein